MAQQPQPGSPPMRPWQLRMRQTQAMRQQQAAPQPPQVVPQAPQPGGPSPVQAQAPVAIPVPAQPQAQSQLQPSLKVDYVAGKLTVSADRTSLSQVLREVGQKTGIDVRGLQDAGGVVSVRFSGVSVAQGVQELLSGINYAVIGGLTSPEEVRQARVVILSATSTAPLDVGGPLGAARLSQARPGGAATTQETRSLVRAELMSSDPAQQDRGFSEVVKLGAKDAFDALQDVITNGDGVARLRALQFMEQDSAIDENLVMSSLREALNDQDNTLRDYAIQALGRQSGSESLDALRQEFENGEASVRLSVLEAVSQRPDSKALIQQAASDPDQAVRALATELMQSNGLQPSGQPLTQPGQQPDVQPSAPVQLQPQPQDGGDPDGTQPDPGDEPQNP